MNTTDYLIIIGIIGAWKFLEILITHSLQKKRMRINGKGYTVSMGELIDRISITNIKMWHLDKRISKLNKSGKQEDKIEAGELAGLTRDSNRERADLREEINLRLEGRSRGSNKIEYTKLGPAIYLLLQLLLSYL